MNNYAGYYMKIGSVEFNDPSPLRETFKIATELVQVDDAQVLASGKLSMKVLPHKRRKIWCDFPPLTLAQYKKYWNALHSDTGGDGMYLTVIAYDDKTDSYITDTYYHNDLMVTPVVYQGEMMYKFDAFELIGH